LFLLVVNVFPMPLAVLAFHAAPPVAAAIVVFAASVAMLARAAGPIAGALALLAVLNLVIALVLDADTAIYVVAPLAGIIGTAAAVVADHVGAWLEQRLAASAEQVLLSEAAASFLDELALRLRDPQPWPTGWFVAHRDRGRTIMADMALTLPPGLLRQAQAADHFIAGIAACAARLHATGATLGVAVSTTATDLAAALRHRSLEDATRIAEDLLDTVRHVTAKGGIDAAPQMLGLAVLLRDFVQAVLAPGASAPAVPPQQPRVWPGRVELRLALQVSVTLALAIAISNLLGGPKPYWIPLTALIVACASFGESLLKSLERIFGTVAGLLAGQLAWIVSGQRPELMVGVIAVAVFCIFFNRAGPYRWVLFWSTLALSVLLHLAKAGEAFYLARLGDTLIGTVIALTVARLLLPLSTAETMRARRSEYLAAIAAQLWTLAAPLCEPGAERPASLLDEAATASLSAMHQLANAEIVEAAMSRKDRLAVRRRLAAADRLARCLVALDSIRPLLAVTADPVIHALLAQLADAAAGFGSLPDAKSIRSHCATLIATAAGSLGDTERLVASLRLLRLLSVMSDAVATLRA
jgi:uncharacterized membrane protein YccC